MSGVRVVIFETTIHQMFNPGGMAHDYVSDLAKDVRRDAKIFAPKRSGNMARKIRVRSERRASRTKVGFYVSSDASYSYFVHEGTRGPIRARSNPKGMWVPKYIEPTGPGSAPRGFRKTVRGQRSQPFLNQALRKNF